MISEPRRRALGLAAVALGGFGPPSVLVFTGFELPPIALALVLVSSLGGGALGAWVAKESAGAGDVPGGAFGALAAFAGLGWLVGFLLPNALF